MKWWSASSKHLPSWCSAPRFHLPLQPDKWHSWALFGMDRTWAAPESMKWDLAICWFLFWIPATTNAWGWFRRKGQLCHSAVKVDAAQFSPITEGRMKGKHTISCHQGWGGKAWTRSESVPFYFHPSPDEWSWCTELLLRDTEAWAWSITRTDKHMGCLHKHRLQSMNTQKAGPSKHYSFGNDTSLQLEDIRLYLKGWRDHCFHLSTCTSAGWVLKASQLITAPQPKCFLHPIPPLPAAPSPAQHCPALPHCFGLLLQAEIQLDG